MIDFSMSFTMNNLTTILMIFCEGVCLVSIILLIKNIRKADTKMEKDYSQYLAKNIISIQV